ncbi:hypothetical protein AWR27_03580 [Spirosoma montaniterrae]|uniref:Secretion system C-terminal sorting domain-containing protein n=2 Tax=Spirosoma montaniterrae TaxID=1178516 RepID=A0A1P9WSZ0_9BACT|nr:hypothetical protein AWR27_03580 [Spirosoma montaniterrae]
MGLLLLNSRIARPQSIPDPQWARAGATVAVTTDGNLATTESLTIAAQAFNYSADRIIKYDLQGNRIQGIGIFQGGFFIGGRLPGISYESIGKIFAMAATQDGGLAIAGKTGIRSAGVVIKTNANGTFRRWEDSDLFAADQIDDMVGTPDGGFVLLRTVLNYDGPTSATIRKYDASGNFLWTKQIAYPTPNPASPDRSLSKGEAIINTADGGFLIVGYYNTTGTIVDLNNLGSLAATGWVAKVDGQGNATWQKLLNGLPLMSGFNGFVPGTIVQLTAATDVIPAADGIGYAIAGAGLAPHSVGVPPVVSAIVELNADGSFKRAKSFGDAPFSDSFITPYTANGASHYAVGNTNRQSGSTPQVSLISTADVPSNSADLFKILAQRTFDGGGFLQGITTASDGSLAFVSSANQLTKLNAPTTANCDFSQPRRVGVWNGLEVQIRQYGDKRVLVTAVVGSASDKHYPRGDNFWDAFTKDSGADALRGCLNGGNTNYGGLDAPANLNAPSGYQSGRETDGAFFFARSSGGLCDFSQPRRVGSWNGLEVQIRQYGDKRVLVTAVVGSASDKHYPRGDNFWDAFTKDSGADALRGCLNGGNTNYGGLSAPANLQTPSGYRSGQEADGAFFFEQNGSQPPTGGPLTLLAPTYDCATGAFRFNISGGNGSTIEYQSPGITDWTTNPNQFVDKDSRTANDVPPFTLLARQSGQVVTYVWNLRAACGRARAGANEPGTRLQVNVLGNPVEGRSAEIDINGVADQNVQVDLIDIQGRIIHQQRIGQAAATERVNIPLGNSRGLLFLNVSTATQRQRLTLVKP